MIGLSLSPRYDLFRFKIPKCFFPSEIREKWARALSREPSVFSDPVEYINESIKGITFPGLSDLLITQQQISTNSIARRNAGADPRAPLGRINIEPTHQNNYKTPANPLELIEKTFKVTFRMNQGLANYWMMYETIMYMAVKHINANQTERFTIEIPDESGVIMTTIYLDQVLPEGISGLEFSYDKVDRQADSFDVTFHFNNIDLEFPEFELES